MEKKDKESKGKMVQLQEYCTRHFSQYHVAALTKNMADTCVRLASRPGLCQICIGFRLG